MFMAFEKHIFFLKENIRENNTLLSFQTLTQSISSMACILQHCKHNCKTKCPCVNWVNLSGFRWSLSEWSIYCGVPQFVCHQINGSSSVSLIITVICHHHILISDRVPPEWLCRRTAARKHLYLYSKHTLISQS